MNSNRAAAAASKRGRLSTGCLLLMAFFPRTTLAREWYDISTIHVLSSISSKPFLQRTETNALFDAKPTHAPTSQPSSKPTSMEPTFQPSLQPQPITPMPSYPPATAPTPNPTHSRPTLQPTSYPTNPTLSPTVDPFPYNPVPKDPPQGYFNYDQSLTAQYGPGWPKLVTHNATTMKIQYQNNGWKRNWEAPDDWYWHEFDDSKLADKKGTYYGWLAFRNPAEWNYCATVGLQSPIDVTANGAFCYEYHQIRPVKGNIAYSQLKPVIESNKLRVILPRRPCLNVDAGLDKSQEECLEPYPPGADLAHWWFGKADVAHVDVRIPSEHLLEGKRYDMEFQIWMLHAFKRRTPVVSIMVEATPGGYNPKFQTLLKLWQDLYKSDLDECGEERRRRQRERREMQQEDGKNDVMEDLEDPASYHHILESFKEATEKHLHRNLTTSTNTAIFNPFDEAFIKTIYFLGYEGSLTEPPCGQWVTWRVLDTPFTVSYTQLFQAQNILFNHVSPKCRRTSVHTPQRMAVRPLQDTFNRPVHKCTSKDYVSDEQKAIWVSQGKSPQVPGQENQ